MERVEARSRSKLALDSIPFVPRPERFDEWEKGASVGPVGPVPPAKTKHVCAACVKSGISLSRAQHRIVEDICEDPAKTTDERCNDLGMLREVESTSRRAVMNFGLIECVGSVGNKRLLFSPTTKGKKWAEAHGISVASEHGGVLHTLILKKAERKLTLAFPDVKMVRRRTGEPGGVRPDSIALLPGADGRRLALQAVVAHRLKDEAINLLKLCGAQAPTDSRKPAGWVDVVISIAVNKRVQKSLEEKIREQNRGQVPPNLVFFNAEEHLVDQSFDWSFLAERDF